MTNFKIYNKDSRKLTKFIEKKSIDFIVFSPPYWKLRDYGYAKQIGSKQSHEEYLEDMTIVFSECFKVLRNGRHMAINIGTVVSDDGMKFLTADFIRLCEKVGFIFRKDIIWHKPRGTTKWQRGATQFSQNPYPLMYNTNINHEFILIFQKGSRGNIDFSKEPKFNKGFVRQMAYSVWDIIPITSPKLDEKHVAPYPEEIPRRLIRLFSFKGDTVLDPFAGAGTTNKVAKQLGRKSIAVEMSKEYCKLIKAKVSSVKFNSVGDEIFDHSGEYEIKIAKEKLEKAERDYKKTKKEYEELTKKRSKKSGIMKFT